MLKNTGVAGRPEEYFEAKRDTGVPPHPGDYLDQLPRTGAGIRDDDTPPHAPPHSSLQGLSGYRQHLERTFRLGSTDNGVFATKLMWRHLPELQALAGELPEYAGLQPVELLTVLFGDPRYVLVSRRDKVRQAVSMWRALQTRSWRLEHGPRAKNPAELQYRFEGIDHLVRSLDADDRGWRDLFAFHGISALEISYEDDLEQDRDRTVGAMLEWLGIELPKGWRAAEPTKRQADALSDEWVAAYHRDCAQRDPDARRAATAAL